MSIDIRVEQLLSFPAASKTLQSEPHVSTIHRWRLKGIRGVRLETILVGGRRYTSLEAIERFAAATTAQANGDPVPVRTSRQRERAVRRAEQELGRP
jgi:Protein of unknown function (DUF1580)